MSQKYRRVKHPHRHSRRLRRVPGLWVRLAFLGLIVVALITGMVGLALKAVRPYHEAGVETARLAHTRRLVADLDARNNALRRRIAYLKTPNGVAVEAHRLGYMHPGEQPLVILGLAALPPDNDSAPGDAPPADTPSGNAPLLNRFLSHLRDL